MKGFQIMKFKMDIGPEYNEEPEIVIKCRSNNKEVASILTLLQAPHKIITASSNGNEYILDPSEILYFESVDGVVYIYDRDKVYISSFALYDIEKKFSEYGFFRCSKSIVINIYAIESLKSEIGNRINAQLTNGEHVIISRRYSTVFRKMLKEACR